MSAVGERGEAQRATLRWRSHHITDYKHAGGGGKRKRGH